MVAVETCQPANEELAGVAYGMKNKRVHWSNDLAASVPMEDVVPHADGSCRWELRQLSRNWKNVPQLPKAKVAGDMLGMVRNDTV